MVTFNLSYESLRESDDSPVIISEFGDGSEVRRKQHDGPEKAFSLRTGWLNKTAMAVYQAFYAARDGELESFTFTSPTDDTTYTVRFAKQLRIEQTNGVFRVQMDFKTIT